MNRETKLVKRQIIANNLRTAIMLYKGNPEKYGGELRRNMNMASNELSLMKMEQIRDEQPTVVLDMREIIGKL